MLWWALLALLWADLAQSALKGSEWTALSALYSATIGPSWNSSSNWGFGGDDDPCTESWYGVTCSGSSVTKLELNEISMQGTLPVQMGDLTNLKGGLLMYLNTIGGTIPSELGLLTKLTRMFQLYSNEFSGSLASEFGQLTKITAYFSVRGNKLTSTLPSELGQLSALKSNFNVYNNEFTGTVPSQLGAFTGLGQRFQLYTNSFSGVIPSELGNCHQLKMLDLSENKLTGTCPSNSPQNS